MSPVDKSAMLVTTTYEESGTCVRSVSKFSDGHMTQVISRYIVDNGQTYMVRPISPSHCYTYMARHRPSRA